MLPLQSFQNSVLAEIIRRQPPSRARTAFAWRLAVGASLARVTTVDQAGSTLIVRATDRRWLVEVERARPVILTRLQALLAPESIEHIQIRS